MVQCHTTDGSLVNGRDAAACGCIWQVGDILS
jgi:hypothetical protein